MEKMYTLDEAAYILGVQLGTVQHWIQEKKMKCLYIFDEDTRHWVRYVTETMLEESLANHTEHALKLIEIKNEKRQLKARLECLEYEESKLYNDLCWFENFKRHY